MHFGEEIEMDDITNKYEFQRILRDAAHYRVLRRVFDSLPADKGDQRDLTGEAVNAILHHLPTVCNKQAPWPLSHAAGLPDHGLAA
jgi:hypothetical protein